METLAAKGPGTSFGGNIPFNYDEYLGPLLMDEFANEMAARVGSLKPKRVLELASGTGRVTRPLLQELPADALLVATDINPAMLQLGRQKTAADHRLIWQTADAMNLPFSDESFDCIVAQFGVMFYSDRPKSYREAYRLLRPGGRYIFNTWNEMVKNPAIQLVKDVLGEYFPVDPPSFYNVPFSYFDVEAIKADVLGGGFSDVNIYLSRKEGRAGSARDAAKGLLEGTPVCAGIMEKDPDALPLLLQTLSERLAKRFGSKEVKVPLESILVTATKN